MDDEPQYRTDVVVTDFDEVARLLERDVAPHDRPAFQAELDRVAPYVIERSGPLVARIQLALLFVADGDLAQLIAAREVADTDWRDLLARAEYGNDRDAIHRWRRRT